MFDTLEFQEKPAQKTLKLFLSFLDVVTPSIGCQGSSAWESARLKTESSQVQTLPLAPNHFFFPKMTIQIDLDINFWPLL